MRIKTGYSFRNAVGHIDEVMDRLVSVGYQSAPISDLSSTFAWVRWRKAAKKRGLVPVFGVTLNVTDSINAKKPSTDEWTFYAIDSIESIHKLIETATNQFHYVPLLTYEQAMAANGVLRIVGTRSNMEELERHGAFRTPSTFFALSPAISKGYYSEVKERGGTFLATSENSYPNATDVALYQVIAGRGASTQTYPQHILAWDEWKDSLRFKVPAEDLDAALAVTQRWLAADGWAELQESTLLHPSKPATLQAMCLAGAAKLGVDLSDPVYAERLDSELELIELKKFEDYFYIVSDMVKWARDRMIVGPARGSSCGSLACYLLEITTIDPIPYGLLFARFIDINRGGWKFPKEFETEGFF